MILQIIRHEVYLHALHENMRMAMCFCTSFTDTFTQRIFWKTICRNCEPVFASVEKVLL
jgi:hypothetical protein